MFALNEAKVVCWIFSLLLISVSLYELIHISNDFQSKIDFLRLSNKRDRQVERQSFERKSHAIPLMMLLKPVKTVDLSIATWRNGIGWGGPQTISWNTHRNQDIKKPASIVCSEKENCRSNNQPIRKLDLKSIFKRASMKQAFTGLEQDDNFGHVTNQIQTNIQKGMAEAIGGTMQVNSQDIMEGVDISWPADILSTLVCAVFVSTDCVGPLPPYTLPFGLPGL